VGQVLDELVKRGYEPALVYDKTLKMWALLPNAGEVGPYMRDGLISNELRQPTRPLAVCAAVLALEEEASK
jgi:hypothetical protein